MAPTPRYLKGYFPLGNADQVGTVNQSSVSGSGIIKAYHYGLGLNVYRTILALSDYRMTVADASASGSQKLFDFPEARIQILGGHVNLQWTSRVADTVLNDAADLIFSLGTAATADATLNGNEVNILASTSATAPTPIGRDGTLNPVAPVNAALTAVTIDGTSTAADLILNVGITTNTLIDADATIGWYGWINMLWVNHGDNLLPSDAAAFMAGVAGNQ